MLFTLAAVATQGASNKAVDIVAGCAFLNKVTRSSETTRRLCVASSGCSVEISASDRDLCGVITMDGEDVLKQEVPSLTTG